MTRGIPAWQGAAVFVLSGFAGLVYEATWARYLKTVLGHEAYAQALVLGVFLGGLAAGAWLAGRKIERVSNPLAVYAAIEAVLALAAIYFHDVFVLVREAIESGAVRGLGTRWVVMTMMIIAQSVLLGATFPLLAAAMTRSDPRKRGETISLLYFANSIGGALGALAVGFVLVDALGLPGSMLAGGLAGAAAGVFAWVMHHRALRAGAPEPAAKVPAGPARGADRGLLAWFVAAAFGTGMASLVYEIVWVRMLALVIGSSTRAFEIMLATFIFGLAMGGLYVRRHIGRRPGLELLAWAQLMMGALVVVSLFTYQELFHAMASVRDRLPVSEVGYTLYGLFSILLSLVLMLGPTFCAGMTLPLLTREAIDRQGERSLGYIYAWNTLGSITGILLAVHVLIPLMGLRLSLAAGATVDLALGVVFLMLARPARLRIGAAAAAALLALALASPRFAPGLISSGPYRSGAFVKDDTVVFLRHGKTATTAVLSQREDLYSIRSNGKSDGAISLSGGDGGDTVIRDDKLTTTMLAALPLLYHPQARTAAVIGLGTGYSSASLLASDSIERLDTLEIEKAVIEGARLFPTNEGLFADDRSRVRHVDAKAYFSSLGSGEDYDIIISEPSNPWVSGLSSLYSVEHFEAMRRALADDGVLVQWFHTYESNPESVASILAAVGEVFPEYDLYTMQDNDVALVTSPDPGRLGGPKQGALASMPKLADRLGMVDIHSPDDLLASKLGDRRLLKPYFDSFRVPANTDYFPVLESFAARGFFLRTTYDILGLHTYFGNVLTNGVLPVAAMRRTEPVSPTSRNTRQLNTHHATRLLAGGEPLGALVLELAEFLGYDLFGAETLFDDDCDMSDEEAFSRAALLSRVVEFADSFLHDGEMAELMGRVRGEVPCLARLRQEDRSRTLLAFMEAVAGGEHDEVVAAGNTLLGGQSNLDEVSEAVVLTKIMLAKLAQGKVEEVVSESFRISPSAPASAKHAVRLVSSHAWRVIDEQKGA